MKLEPRSPHFGCQIRRTGGTELHWPGLGWKRFQPERPQEPHDYRRLSRRDPNPRTTQRRPGACGGAKIEGLPARRARLVKRQGGRWVVSNAPARRLDKQANVVSILF
jgi:hypothetical protein